MAPVRWQRLRGRSQHNAKGKSNLSFSNACTINLLFFFAFAPIKTPHIDGKWVFFSKNA